MSTTVLVEPQTMSQAGVLRASDKAEAASRDGSPGHVGDSVTGGNQRATHGFLRQSIGTTVI